MRKVIAAINMTIDGVCDHTAGLPDEEVHQHYADLLDSADIILYGRTTYQLMQYWQTLLKKPFRRQNSRQLRHSNRQNSKNCFFTHTQKYGLAQC